MCYKLPDTCVSRAVTGMLAYYPPIGKKVTVQGHFTTGTVVARKKVLGGDLVLIKEDPQTWHVRYPSGQYRCVWHPIKGPGGFLYQGTDVEADAFRNEYIQRFEAEVNSAMAL